MSLLKPLNPRFNRNHPLAPGCLAFWPVAETAGDAVDIVNAFRLPPQNNVRRAASPTGLGGLCEGNLVGFNATTPNHLKITYPVTIACLFRQLSQPSGSSTFFGVTFSNADNSPYLGYALGYNNGAPPQLHLQGNSAGAYFAQLSTTTSTSILGLQSSVVGVITPTARTLYLNGAVISSSTTATSNPAYSGTSTTGLGYYSGPSRSAGMLVQCGGIWNRELSPSEIELFYADPFGICRPDRERRRTYPVPAIPTGRVNYLQTAILTTGASTYTFTAQNFGAERPDRVIILSFATRAVGNVAITASSVTIGGISATIAVQQRNFNINTCMAMIAYATVPTGASGDVVVTLSHSTLRASASLYLASGIATTVSDSGTSTATNPTYDIDVPAKGIAVAAVAAPVTSYVWTGLDERYDTNISGSAPQVSGASNSFDTVQTNLTVTATPSGISESSQVAVFVSFGPAPASITSRLLKLRRRAVFN